MNGILPSCGCGPRYLAEPAKTHLPPGVFAGFFCWGKGRRTVMANRGRPRVIDPKARELMIGLVGMGCSRRRAARHAGVSRSALYLALREDEHFAARMRLAEMQPSIAP